MITNSTPIGRISAVAAITALLLGATTLSASARQDRGDEASVTSVQRVAQQCLVERVGTQYVRCDNLTGNGVAAPGWIPRSGSTAPRPSVQTPDAGIRSSLAPSWTAKRLTTSGSAAGGFAWSSDAHFETTVDCATFDAHVDVAVSDRFTLTLNQDGSIPGFTESVSAPRGVWTNTKTGASAVVSGHYVQVAKSIPGTQKFNRQVTATTSVDGETAKGATSKAAQIVRDESLWRDLTGQHGFADAMLTQPSMCAAIA